MLYICIYFVAYFCRFLYVNKSSLYIKKNANFKMYPPPPKKTELPSEKINPPVTTRKISNILTRNSSHWEYLNPMRNLKLLEKYQPPPPPPSKKKQNLNLQENEKTSLLVKVSTTLKLPQPCIMKKPQTPHLKNSQFLKKKPNSIGKIFNSFEVTRPIKPSPHEKISISENLTPFRKLQSSYAHENRN